ncbi:MAG TPA: class I SAM-dependent methyltransferase [Mycobacteriales bacterium]|jgi:SAM-dependent methyltransferase|nr:class I SAM-dependent methyltransferase [Mycobacteriales bacterium]
MHELSDFVRAPNQADDPGLYEVENAAMDPDGVLAAALWSAAPWDGRDVLDLGCGSGYWLSSYRRRARSVLGVEPDRSLLPLAAARDASIPVVHGSAEHIPVPDAAVDVVHARFAYFFPPDRDAGLAEVMRVLRPGGALVVVDNDQRWGEFAELLALSPWAAPQGKAETTDMWWAERGAVRHEVHSSWRFPDRAGLEAVLRLEFSDDLATAWLGDHPGRHELSYGYVLFVATKR